MWMCVFFFPAPWWRLNLICQRFRVHAAHVSLSNTFQTQVLACTVLRFLFRLHSFSGSVGSSPSSLFALLLSRFPLQPLSTLHRRYLYLRSESYDTAPRAHVPSAASYDLRTRNRLLRTVLDKRHFLQLQGFLSHGHYTQEVGDSIAPRRGHVAKKRSNTAAQQSFIMSAIQPSRGAHI